MILTNPFSKGKWFTLKVEGVPLKIYLPAFGSYELANVSNNFNTENITESQVIETFFENTVKPLIYIPQANRMSLTLANKYENIFLQKTSEVRKIIKNAVNGEGLLDLIASIGSFFYNNVNNVSVIFNLDEYPISISSQHGAMLQGVESVFNLSDENDWYIPTLTIAGGKEIIITSFFLSNYLQNLNDSITMTAYFENRDPVEFTIVAEHYYTAASIASFSNDFVLSSPLDMTSTITWNDATSLIGVVNSTNSDILVNGVDYSISGDVITIYSSYLMNLSEGSYEFTFDFDLGSNVSITINVVSANTAAVISPDSGEFSISAPNNIRTNISYINASSVSSIIYNGYELQLLIDYTYNAALKMNPAYITINEKYLSSIFTDVGQSVDLIINFNNGDPITFTVTSIN